MDRQKTIDRTRWIRVGGSGLLLLLLLALPLSGQYLESFESATPSWKRSETDCVLRRQHWSQRRANETEKQNRFERIEFRCGPGSYVYVAHDLPPALIIPELKASLRVRSSRGGVRLFARVVLPNTKAPNGKGPMKALLKGPVSRKSDQWETLSFDGTDLNLDKMLKEETWFLRTKYGTIDDRGAYIDKLVLNVYSGEGQSQVDIDNLSVEGLVDAEDVVEVFAHQDQQVRPAGFQQETDTGKVQSLVKRDGTVVLVNKQPFFPRIIQHNGEPFDYLKALGFNVIELSRLASESQLRLASKLDLWLICPPPTSVGLKPIEFKYDRVLAWSVGQKLVGRNLPLVEQRVREIRESDLRYGRPIIGHVDEEWSQLARLLDIINAGVEPLATSFIASQYSDWLIERRQAIGDSKPLWADIQTELPTSLVNQIKTLVPRVPPIPIEAQQVRFLCYEAVTAGCRGMRFRSNNRLDGLDPSSRLRAVTLEWINRELIQLEPWIVGGALMGQIPVDDAGLTVTAINTNRSRLLLAQRSTHHEQYVAGELPLASLNFRDADSPYTYNAYRLSHSGLSTLSTVRSAAGMEIEIENAPTTMAVVLTQDPLVVNQLTSSFSQIGKQSMPSLRLELTRQWLAIEQLIEAQMTSMGRNTDPIAGPLNEAAGLFSRAQTMLQQGNDQIAETALDRADQRLAMVRRELIIDPLGMFQSKSSAPLTTHCSLIPLHWELATRLSEGKWNPNGLAGGDFENLQQMQNRGWQNRRVARNDVQTSVKLTQAATVDGRRGLEMQVRPSSGSNVKLESSPLQVESPPVNVRGGQLVRIHGWVHVPQPIERSMDGLRITDSLGGPVMAERIPITNGWQEFTLYRGAANDGAVTVQFDMTGIGTAYLDEVTIRTIDLPVQRSAEAIQDR